MTMERLRFSHLLANKSVIWGRHKPFLEEIDEFLPEKKRASFDITERIGEKCVSLW